LKVKAGEFTPQQELAAEGLRHRISQYGLHVTSKMFTPPEWAAIVKRYLEPMTATELPPLKKRLKRSITRWLNDQLYFPRLPEPPTRRSFGQGV
jgi:hypothetical protein